MNLLVYDIVPIGKSLPMFRKCLLPPPSAAQQSQNSTILECLSPDNVYYKRFLNVSDYLPADMTLPEDLNRLISIRFK
jgi:hypothetical protein